MTRIKTRWRMASRVVRRRIAAGVSLIELIAVAIVLGVFALIVVPNVVHSLDLAKGNMLKTQIATVQEASDSYYAQRALYPADCQPSASEPGCELNWQAGDPFVPDFLHTIPSASPAVYGLAPSNGATVYWGVDPTGTVFATQIPPNMNDPDGWSPLPVPRWEQNTTVTSAPTTGTASVGTVDLTTANTSIDSTPGVGTGSGQWAFYSASGGAGVYLTAGVDYSANGLAGLIYQAPAGSTISQLRFTGVAFVDNTAIANPVVYYRTSLTGTWTPVWHNTAPSSGTTTSSDGAETLSLPGGVVQVLFGNQLSVGSDLLNGNPQYLDWYTIFQSPVATITPPGTATLDTCTAVTGMSGCQIPGGATATANSSYDSQTPNLAIDGNLTTSWSAGATSGTLTVTFPHGVPMAGLYVDTQASPASSQTYTVSVLDNAQWVSEGTTTVSVGTSPGVVFLPLPAGTFDGVSLQVSDPSSWILIYEITTAPAS